MTAKLSDLQYVLLAIAAKRSTGSILPPSTSIGVTRTGLTRAITALIKHGLAEQVAADDQSSIWRNDGARRFAAVITEAGRMAVAEADGKNVEQPEANQSEPTMAPAPAADTAKPQTKRALLIAMLEHESGGTLAKLSEATGWLPHTTRAALTGLRKKGHLITATKVDGVRRYHITGAA